MRHQYSLNGQVGTIQLKRIKIVLHSGSAGLILVEGPYNGGLLVQVRLCLPPYQTYSCNLVVPTTTQSLIVIGKCPKLTGFLCFKTVFGHSFNWVEEKAQKYLVIIIKMYTCSARCFKNPIQSQQIQWPILLSCITLAKSNWILKLCNQHPPWTVQLETAPLHSLRARLVIISTIKEWKKEENTEKPLKGKPD